MKKLLFLSLIFAGSALLVSCNKTVFKEGSGDPIPMRVVASIDGTKGSMVSADLTDFYLRIDTSDPTCNYFGHIEKSTGGAWSASSKLYWADESSPVTYSAAFYPGHPFTAFDFTDGASLTLPTDQSTQAKLNSADLLAIPATVTKYSDSVDGELSVALSHGLSIVNFTLTLSEPFFDQGIGTTSNPVTDLVIKGSRCAFTYMPQTGEVIAKAGSEASITPLTGEYDHGTSIAKASHANYEAILVPQTLLPGELTVSFRIDGETYDWSNADEIKLECGKSYNLNVGMNLSKLPFLGLSATYPASGFSEKTGWEMGDVIFVFFNHVAAPRYAKMVYDGTTWISYEMSGANEIPGCLGLVNGDSGTLRAIYLPFGSETTSIRAGGDGTNFEFDPPLYSFYYSASASYSVSGGQIQAQISNFSYPDGYVHFKVADAHPVDNLYRMGTDAVIPVGVASVSADGTVVETSDKAPGDDMPGYAFKNGYLFSGKISNEYSFGYRMYYSKTNNRDGSRSDRFSTADYIANHYVLTMPASASSDWIPVGKDLTVYSPYFGTIHTCNYGQTVPEAVGPLYSSEEVAKLGVAAPNWTSAMSGSVYWYWMTVHGQIGVVVRAGSAFLFLPATHGAVGQYWDSFHGDNQDVLFFNATSKSAQGEVDPAISYALRN